MYDDLFNELIENGLTSKLNEELEGYYVFNSSQTKPVRLQFDGESQLSPLELQNQNPTLKLETNTLTMCLSPYNGLLLDGSWLLNGTQTINGVKTL